MSDLVFNLSELHRLKLDIIPVSDLKCLEHGRLLTWLLFFLFRVLLFGNFHLQLRLLGHERVSGNLVVKGNFRRWRRLLMMVLILWVHHHHLRFKGLELSLNSWVNRLKFFWEQFFLIFYHFYQGLKLSLDYLTLGFNLLRNSCLNRIKSDEDIVLLRISCQRLLYQILNGPNLVDSILGIGFNAFHNIFRLFLGLNALIPGLENNFVKSIIWPNDVHHKF